MPDYMDQLVEAEVVADDIMVHNAASKGLTPKDRELLAEGVMSERNAKELTEAIKSCATATWVLVKKAHDGKAWKSLGYDTWEAYVSTEFSMSASRSYQLINQAEVIEQLEQAAPAGTKLMLTEAQTRDIRSVLPKITEKVKNIEADNAATAAEQINQIIKQERESIKNDNQYSEDDKKSKKKDKNQADTDGVNSFNDYSESEKVPKVDRSSGSTTDPDFNVKDYGRDVVGDDEDGLNDNSLYTQTQESNVETDLTYFLQYFDRIRMEAAPQSLAAAAKISSEELKTRANQIVQYFTRVQNLL